MLIPVENFILKHPSSFLLNFIEDLKNNIDNTEIYYTENMEIPMEIMKKHNSVFLVEGSGYYNINLYKKLKMKVILFYDDIHYWTNDAKTIRHNLFRDADVILLPCYKHFLKMNEYKEYHNKSIFFPYYISNNILNINIKWNDKEDKVLLTGARTGFYDFRRNIKENEYIKILNHPGYHGQFSHDIIGEKYYEYISKFKGGIVTSANKCHSYNGCGDFNLEYTLKKYFEIPACNVVPFIQPTIDTDELGFINYKNCIFIDEKNYNEKIKKHLFDEEIAINARNFIKEKHLFSNRIDIIKNIL